MSFRTSPAVPIPSELIEGHIGGYTRHRAYVNSDNEVEGGRVEIKAFNDRGSACVEGGVYLLEFDGDEEELPKVATVSAQTVDKYCAVALAATADQAWGWFAIEGYVDALVDGDSTDVAKDDTLKLTTATNADAFIQDQSGYTVTADTFAVACAANASTEALTKVYLLGKPADAD